MPEPILVYVDLNAEPHFVGHLWAHSASTESASFQYAAEWCASPLSFALEPALKLGPGSYHTDIGKALFGAIGDSAPDRWGRTIMGREAQRQAKEANTTPRSLREIDFLLMVNDEARIGALRFKKAIDEPFLASYDGVPPVIALGRLLNAAQTIENHDSTDQEIKDIFAPGSSLGGARPKACIKGTDGKLYVAKFPSVKDEWDVPLWEYVALCMAKESGIVTPNARLETVGQSNVLLTERFDRADQGIRLPYLSAMSMLSYKDGDHGSYLEIADSLSGHGAQPTDDKKELWKRIVLNIMISNYDDHLRNHGFLYVGSSGWRLSPVFDLEPTPAGKKSRYLHTYIGLEEAEASLDVALSVSAEFGLSLEEARTSAQKVGQAVQKWRFFAQQSKAKAREIEMLSTAFEHDDLKAALKPVSVHTATGKSVRRRKP